MQWHKIIELDPDTALTKIAGKTTAILAGILQLELDRLGTANSVKLPAFIRILFLKLFYHLPFRLENKLVLGKISLIFLFVCIIP